MSDKYQQTTTWTLICYSVIKTLISVAFVSIIQEQPADYND